MLRPEGAKRRWAWIVAVLLVYALCVPVTGFAVMSRAASPAAAERAARGDGSEAVVVAITLAVAGVLCLVVCGGVLVARDALASSSGRAERSGG